MFFSLYNIFHKWAVSLKEELEVENKWESFQNVVQSLELSQTSTEENERFTASEYLEIKSKMEALKSSLEQLQLPAPQLDAITNKLDYLAEKVTVLGKFDWRILFIGRMVSLVMQLSLSQEQGKLLWEIIRRVFSAYFIA